MKIILKIILHILFLVITIKETMSANIRYCFEKDDEFNLYVNGYIDVLFVLLYIRTYILEPFIS